MRTKIVAGNWKMNQNLTEAQILTLDIIANLNAQTPTRVIVAPPYTNLYVVAQLAQNTKLEVAAQNMHQASSGAFTGEISADMIKSTGVNVVILGHSERREYFGEDDAWLAQKVDAALKENLEIIFCFGEKLDERKAAKHFEVVKNQLQKALFHLKPEQWKSIILAYEPVWAIGTGETATPEQAQEMHQFIRETLATQYDQNLADKVSILYGGSVKPDNALEIFAKPDVDGGLIGGASLKAGSFLAIVNAA